MTRHAGLIWASAALMSVACQKPRELPPPMTHADAGTSTAEGCAVAVPTDCVHPAVSAACMGGWCTIPTGCFVMGSPKCEQGRGRYSEPETVTRLNHRFTIQQHELTQTECLALGIDNPSVHEGRDGISDCAEGNCPVGNLNWYEALALANRMSEHHSPSLQQCYVLENCTSSLGHGLTCTTIGQTTASLYECTGFRVPTEAEWEYAARAGTRTAFYSGELTNYRSDGGCSATPALDSIAWYCANSGRTTHAVGAKSCNAWGLCDMLGNAGEWVSDEFNGLGYGVGPRTDPGAVISNPDKAGRIIRGGSFNGPPALCRSAMRYDVAGFGRGPGTGVRLVRTLP